MAEDAQAAAVGVEVERVQIAVPVEMAVMDLS